MHTGGARLPTSDLHPLLNRHFGTLGTSSASPALLVTFTISLHRYALCAVWSSPSHIEIAWQKQHGNVSKREQGISVHIF